MKKKVLKIGKVLLFIGIIALVIIGFRACCAYQSSSRLSMLVERPNSEIVKIVTDESTFLTTHYVIGCVDFNDIDSFINNTLDKNVKVYNPYKEDDYILIRMDSITSITKLSKEEFVASYSPNS